MSLNTVTIHVAPTLNADTTVSVACDSLVWQGNTYTTSGMYYDTLQTVAGCDSVLTLDLTINDSYSVTTVPMTACDSMSWQVRCIRQVEFTMTVADAIGCDSIISIDLTINSS